ncbi:unnamed protein product [Mycena citricolor]|uniref:Uncharacterized protein n=1 Tax=Mycena citricolor TaxID=2018698 RepID=A0AAD2H7Y1_9AGAR|nr:unnamed protein product [Mycena citricolor]
MVSAPESVLQHAALHAQLLSTIASLDYVTPALAEQNRHIDGLEQKLRDTKFRVTRLEMVTKKERKEHESLRDSTTRRFAARMTGRKDKFEAKASKEEREYVEALENEMREKNIQETVETLLAEAHVVHEDLQQKLQQHQRAQQDLNALYSKIFDGPTQAYPEDDRLEYVLKSTQDRYNEIQGRLNTESQAARFLLNADKSLDQCLSFIESALGYSTWDMWGGGTMSDMMERDALSSAQQSSMRAEMFVQQAQMASRIVGPIGQISIAHGSILSDVIFDNIFSDMAFHGKIKESKQNVEAVQSNLQKELLASAQRIADITRELSVEADALTAARKALDDYRRSIFDHAGVDSIPQNDYPSSRVEMPRGPQDPPPSQVVSDFQGAYAPPLGPPPPQYVESVSPVSGLLRSRKRSMFHPSVCNHLDLGIRQSLCSCSRCRADIRCRDRPGAKGIDFVVVFYLAGHECMLSGLV